MKYTFTVSPLSEDSMIKEARTFDFINENQAKAVKEAFDICRYKLEAEVSDVQQVIDEKDKVKFLERISVSFDAETDGDYGFRNDDFSKYMERMSGKDKEYSYTKPHCFSFCIRYVCDGKANDYDAKMQARDFIENIVRHIDFGHLHLMKNFYDMYDKARNWIFNNTSENEFYWNLSGNYEGTELRVYREYIECAN